MTTATKLRCRFAKRGDLRLVSHHDIMRCLERMTRRARTSLAMSQGFNAPAEDRFRPGAGAGDRGPGARSSTSSSPNRCEPASLLPPAGGSGAGRASTGSDAQALPAAAPPPRPVAVEYWLRLPPERHEAARAALARLLASTSWPATRRRPDRDRDREVSIDLRPFVIDAEADRPWGSQARLKVCPGRLGPPRRAAGSLGLRDLLDQGAVLARTHVELA